MFLTQTILIRTIPFSIKQIAMKLIPTILIQAPIQANVLVYVYLILSLNSPMPIILIS